MLAHLPLEYQLTCLLCRPAITDRIHAQIERVLSGGMDWDLFFRFIEAEGIFPLVSRHAEQALGPALPLEVRGWLLAHTARLRERAELFARELAEVLADLDRAGVRVVPFKGPVLTQQVWGDEHLALCADLDLLLRPEDLAPAIESLRPRGYELTDGALRALVALGIRAVPLFRRDGLAIPITLDLHADAAERWFRRPVSLERIWDRLAERTFRDVRIHVLPEDWNLVYLAVHAYNHRFQGLRWLAGFHELLTANADNWPLALRRAEEAGVREELIVTREICGAILSEDMIGPEALTPGACRLVREAFRRARPNSINLRSTLMLLTGRQKLGLLLSRTFRPTYHDVVWLTLPRPFYHFYPVLRPVRLITQKFLPSILRSRTDS